ncbi:calcium-dependent phosphotriesterase [Panus rudis PR-1116 ss-1]|nr:calcium-dependent phosphotriesterase [Panus rudis PR-1116 ss-1]
MGAILTVSFLLVTSLAGILHPTYIAPLLRASGIFNQVTPLHNEHCTLVPELEGCEKIVLHEDTSILYLACSRISNRMAWLPTGDNLNATGRAEDDYIATYSVDTGKIKRFKLRNFDVERGLSVHGMDVVRSSSDPSKLYFYLVNHRKPLSGDARVIGADSVIEIFETKQGSDILQHVKTFQDSVIIVTPNDIVGATDGTAFWFTNDHGARTGLSRVAEAYLKRAYTSVGYCHIDEGCKFAARNLHGANGIAKSRSNDTFYVGSAKGSGIQVFEKQADNTLAWIETIETFGKPLDNLSVDSNEALWAAMFPRGFDMLNRFKNTRITVPSGAIRVTQNTDERAYSGEKYKVEKVTVRRSYTSVA